jgi:hypothetical protein
MINLRNDHKVITARDFPQAILEFTACATELRRHIGSTMLSATEIMNTKLIFSFRMRFEKKCKTTC